MTEPTLKGSHVHATDHKHLRRTLDWANFETSHVPSLASTPNQLQTFIANPQSSHSTHVASSASTHSHSQLCGLFIDKSPFNTCSLRDSYAIPFAAYRPHNGSISDQVNEKISTSQIRTATDHGKQEYD